MLGFYPINCFM